MNCLTKYGEQKTGELLFPLQSIMKRSLIYKGGVINIWGNVTTHGILKYSLQS